MLRFDDISFAALGLVAAAIPLLIHLLFRRRFKTVHWAAVTLLRQALESKHKSLRLRDLVVLALRMIAVVAFGLMLARPHFRSTSISAILPAIVAVALVLAAIGTSVLWATGSRNRFIGFGALAITTVLVVAAAGMMRGNNSQSENGGESSFRSRQPVHAVLLIDNSRSMGVESLGQSLLDRAKARSIEFIDSLPLDSRITVLPIAGSESRITLDAFKSKDEAKRTIGRIKLTDVPADLRQGLEQAGEACLRTMSPSIKRIVLLTDGQQNSWRNIDPDTAARVPDLQVVNVTKSPAHNVWVSQFHLEDGLASTDAPGRFLARLHSTSFGPELFGDRDNTPHDVQVRLAVDGIDVASQSVTLTPGQEREIEFRHRFTTQPDPSQPVSVVATITIQPESAAADSLARDNQQQLVVPIVTSLPIIFIDQYGDQENLEQNKIGETYALRHLMAPRSSTEDLSPQLIQIEHLRPNQATRESLQSARLVVVGGLESPPPDLVSLLREFVEQGGPLVILAGGQFDPVAWTETAWRSGRGILPLPLDANSIGIAPDEAQQMIKPFFVSYPSMQHDFFLIENEDPRTLESLFQSTPFFKAVRCELSSERLEQLFRLDCDRLRDDESFLQQFAARQRALDGLNPIPEEDQQRYRALNPTWWNARSTSATSNRKLSISEQAKRQQPRALAMFDDLQSPLIVERQMGAGRVVFFTSGVTSNWNLLRNSGAMYLFHRMFCRLIGQTLPRENFDAGERITIPCEIPDGSHYSVMRPDGSTEALSIDHVGDGLTNVTINRPLTAGIYTISSTQNNSPAQNEQPRTSSQNSPRCIAVNGTDSESDLSVLSTTEIQSRLADHAVVLNDDQPIRIEGRGGAGRDLWKQFGYLLLGCLLLEMLILARQWRSNLSMRKTTS